MRSIILLSLFIFFITKAPAQQKRISPLPTTKQLAWHEMEFYLFMHFGPNTFTDKEWGLGDEPENVFNPSQLDCRQWCRIAKAAGAKGIIITAKHHDGFCLWPSKYSRHTVTESGWKNGKGDVLKELSKACAANGLKFGVYLSPWDRNHPKYGTPEYNDVFVNMMKEIFSNYGPIWELWWDGANGEGPNGKKQVYDWKRFEKTVRDLSPTTVIFSDIGPDIRWVGNENGIAGSTNWNYLDTAGFKRGEGAPPTDTLNQGNINGRNWIPAECDVSIRPGWFYHKEENEKVKTPEQLFSLYLKSVGRGANLLLNVPPDRRGLINSNDSIGLMGFKKLRQASFKRSVFADAKIYMDSHYNSDITKKLNDGNNETFERSGNTVFDSIQVICKNSKKINCLVLQEPIKFGQTINGFEINFFSNGKMVYEQSGSTIGRKRIITFPSIIVDQITIKILSLKNTSFISEVQGYLVNGQW